MSTRYWILAACLGLSASPRSAVAADRVKECIGEHVEAQLLRKQQRLVEAQAHLLECAAPTCPELVRAECTALSREVEAALPRVVLEAIDADGRPTTEPWVSIDGAADLVPLDGRTIPLDPGEHQLRFEQPDGAMVELTVVLAESERDRRIVAEFGPRGPVDARPRVRRWPTNVMLVSGGVAAVALGSFTFFAIAGRSVENQLDRCKPSCESQADIDRMRSRYLIADVSLGVALVSAGVGIYAWTQRSPAPVTVGSPSPSGPSRPRVSFTPVATPRVLGLAATGEF